MPGARWFEGARLNYADNLLRPEHQGTALVFYSERGDRIEMSREELRRDVAALASALRSMGVGEGDRVAGLLPNRPEAVVAMLACASLGAVWSSCSPDFGAGAVLDRFGQIRRGSCSRPTATSTTARPSTAGPRWLVSRNGSTRSRR